MRSLLEVLMILAIAGLAWGRDVYGFCQWALTEKIFEPAEPDFIQQLNSKIPAERKKLRRYP